MPTLSETPVFATPPDLKDPTGHFSVWFTEPLGMVTQFAPNSEMTRAIADLIVDEADAMLRAAGVSPAHTGCYVHEWSGMTSLDRAARGKLVQWGMDVRRNVKLCAIVLAPSTPTLVRMSVTAASAALSATGGKCKVIEDLQGTLKEYGITHKPLAIRGRMEGLRAAR